jgi:hypothetical protein
VRDQVQILEAKIVLCLQHGTVGSVPARRLLTELLGVGTLLFAIESAALRTPRGFGRLPATLSHKRCSDFLGKSLGGEILVAELRTMVIDIDSHDVAKLHQ